MPRCRRDIRGQTGGLPVRVTAAPAVALPVALAACTGPSPAGPRVGGGRVWALEPAAGVLHALDPATGRSTDEERVGVANRFATPALYGSAVIVPTLSGIAVVDS